MRIKYSNITLRPLPPSKNMHALKAFWNYGSNFNILGPFLDSSRFFMIDSPYFFPTTQVIQKQKHIIFVDKMSYLSLQEQLTENLPDINRT